MKKKIVVTLACVVCLIAAACSSKKSPTAVADEFLTAFKTQDLEKVKALSVEEDVENEVTDTVQGILGDTGENKEDEANTDLFLEKLMDFDYTVGEETINGDNATVEVTFKTYDFSAMIASYFEKALSKAFELAFSGASEEEMNAIGTQIIEEELEAMTEKTRETKTTLPLVKKDGEWKVAKLDEDSEFVDAMLGGLLSVIKSFDEIGESLSGSGETDAAAD